MDLLMVGDDDLFDPGALWTRDRIQLLVSLYANEELLWNTSSSGYHHKEKRRGALQRMASALDLTVDDVMKKIKHIRTYYLRELNKTKKSKDGQYKPRWPLYRILDSFLHDHVLLKKPSPENESQDNSATDVDEDNNESEDLQMKDFKLLMGQPTAIKSSLNSHNENSPAKRHSAELQNHLFKRLKIFPNSPAVSTTPSGPTNSHSSRQEDPDELFGRHVANELRLIKDIKAKQFAKLQIHNILFNAQFGLTTVPQDMGISLHLSEPLKKCSERADETEK